MPSATATVQRSDTIGFPPLHFAGGCDQGRQRGPNKSKWTPSISGAAGWKGLGPADLKAVLQEDADPATRQLMTDFATANTRDFQGLGFQRVYNPIA